MSGKAFLAIFLPRYSTLAGAGEFVTLPFDATRFERVSMHVWRGQMVGTNPGFSVSFEESTDKDGWFSLNPTGADPGQYTEQVYSYDLARRYLRVRIVLGGTGPVATCYAFARLEKRREGVATVEARSPGDAGGV